MTDFARDPMGFKLMSWNKPKPAPEPAKKPEAPPSPPPTYCYYNVHPQPCYQYLPPMMYHQPMFYQHVYPSYYVAAPLAPAPAPVPKHHVCVNCNEKKKCKACIKAEDAKKTYVYKPTYNNPRTPAR